MARDTRRSQHKRSPVQEAQTRWMRGFRHHRPSQNEIEAFQCSKQLSNTDNERKLKREVAEEKRIRLNSERREKRAKGKVCKLEEEVGGLEGRVEELENTVRVASDERADLLERVEGTHGENVKLREDLKRLTARFRSRVRREPQKIDTAVKRALSSVFVTQQNVYEVKTPDGTIQNWARNVILHLVCVSNVPAAKTWTAFCSVTEGLGIVVEGSWSPRSAGRVVLEGALAAEEMIVEDFANALACTFSADGATHKSIPYVSRWAVMIPSQGLKPKDRFLGVTPELDHTTITQVESFKRKIQDLCDDYNASPFGTEHYFDPRAIWRKMTGYLSDHAADQKKVFRELAKYHSECDLELRGEAVIVAEDPETKLEVTEVFDKKKEEMLQEVGGVARWAELPVDDRLRLAKKLVRDAEICLGERVLERLPAEQRQEASGCFWSGCGMHKDLNAVKEGAERMSRWWEKVGRVPPVALANKFKTESGAGCEVRRSDRGGVKLTNLVGALVRHRDTGRGQQDRFRTFCRKAIGYEVSFPDTSNTRYQCYTYAAAEILHNHQLYLDFLDFIAITKTSTPGELNHMEENIRRGITDDATLTELIVLTLYGEAVSAPFTRFLRSSEERNGLDLGPDYDHFKRQIKNLIDNPGLLISPNIDPAMCSLDGQPWQNADVIHKIEKVYPDYPDLEGALVAFFEGALDKLGTFTEEFKEGSPISKATPEERWLAFRRPTNDRNEGTLGLLRCMYRRFSNIKFGQLNARLMSKLNPDVHGYMKNMSSRRRFHLRGAARKVDQSHAFDNFRDEYADANAANAAQKQADVDRRKKKADARLAKLQAFNPILNLTGRKMGDDRVDRMKEQLRWHREIDGDKDVPPYSHLKKAELWEAMTQAVERYQVRSL
ncbi:hypothetical protein BJ322DRAFT_1172093, partial [Thelephora terrestris]